MAGNSCIDHYVNLFHSVSRTQDAECYKAGKGKCSIAVFPSRKILNPIHLLCTDLRHQKDEELRLPA